MVEIKLKELECLRCGYKWVPRVNDVRQCPRCRSAFWDVPKKKNPRKYRRVKRVRRR